MKTILLYSGGLDSTVLLYRLRDQGHSVRCLSVEYGQRHAMELAAAKSICEDLGVEWRSASLHDCYWLFGASTLTGLTGPLDGTSVVVPNRNMVFLSLGIAWAITTGANAVAYGAHTGDRMTFPDCREEFADAMAHAASLCHEHPIRILRPFIAMTKREIVREGRRLGAPLERTWSCYAGGKVPCGECGTCRERQLALEVEP